MLPRESTYRVDAMMETISSVMQVVSTISAILLAIAGFEKQKIKEELRVVIAQVPYIPETAIKLLAGHLGSLEILIGILYFFAPMYASYLIFILYFAFALVSGHFLNRGKKIRCNCFGKAFSAEFTASKTIINLSFAIVAFMNASFLTQRIHPLYTSFVAAVTILGFSVVNIINSSKQFIRNN
jgi:hypothetical protein